MNVEAAMDESTHIGLSLSITVGGSKRVAIGCEAKGLETAF